MKIVKQYRYIGINGSITSSVLLQGIDHVKMLTLQADVGKLLINGDRKVYSVTILPEELEEWKEIPDELNK